MRKRQTAKFADLTATGQRTISLTPSTSAESGVWETGAVKKMDGFGRFNMIRRFWNMNTLVINQPASGASVINWDMLGRATQSAQLISEDLGTIYSHKNTRGPVLQHLIAPISLGYRYPQPARDQIATADANYTVNHLDVIPLSHECMLVPDESAQAALFFDKGELEFLLSANDIFDSTSTGATVDSSSMQCLAEYFPTTDRYLGVPVQWQDRQIAGGGDAPILRLVGQQTGWQGLRNGCALGGMFWLTNAADIGLDGPDGTDNFSQIQVQALNQPAVKNLDGFFNQLRMITKFQPRAGLATTILSDGAGWPVTMADQPDGTERPAANAQNMFLPIVAPAAVQYTSLLDRWNGDLQVDFTVTVAISAAHRFVTFEAMEFQETTARALGMKAFGTDQIKSRKMGGGGDIINAGQLRYTAIEF